MAPVVRAVIPAAGKGTRMREVSGGAPKELLRVGGVPAIRFALAEAVGAGLEEIAIVVSPAKRAIRESVDGELDRGELAVRVTYVVQEQQRGLGDAMLLCRDFAAGDPFALLLPDNVFPAPEVDFGKMVRVHEETGLDVIGVVELDEKSSGHFGHCGLIEFETVRPGVLDIRRLDDKRPGRLEIKPGERVTRTCGRYVCRPHVFEYLERSRPALGELDEVPAYQAIIAEQGATGCVLPGPLFDVGHPLGYAAANAYLGS